MKLFFIFNILVSVLVTQVESAEGIRILRKVTREASRLWTPGYSINKSQARWLWKKKKRMRSSWKQVLDSIPGGFQGNENNRKLTEIIGGKKIVPLEGAIKSEKKFVKPKMKKGELAPGVMASELGS